MVTFKQQGRMGNFLFQAAAAIGYAKRHDLYFSFPSTTNDAFNNPLYLQHLVNRGWNKQWPSILVTEDGHAYQEIPFKMEWRSINIVLSGYWQSEKYFLEYRDEILDLFDYTWEPWQGVVSVHVRRGDYLRLTQKHPPVPAAWYESAMERFPKHEFMFFSDDIEWCRNTFRNHRNVHFSGGQTIEDDLVGMSCCEHHISSASTFGWWGAWLNRNPNRRVVIPSRWFMPQEEARNDTTDIVPASWERIPN